MALSACGSSHGRDAGEGYLGLERAFQVAHAGTVVASLWSVDDEPTQRLIERALSRALARRTAGRGSTEGAQQSLRKEGKRAPTPACGPPGSSAVNPGSSPAAPSPPRTRPSLRCHWPCSRPRWSVCSPGRTGLPSGKPPEPPDWTICATESRDSLTGRESGTGRLKTRIPFFPEFSWMDRSRHVLGDGP